ncbi:MAG TPA: hypothetical protein VMR08_03740 [Patescibacteria group bacterium]|jgi:hypothetical protein|nr:hypothetical protein [Patescibacteria group bacterium]
MSEPGEDYPELHLECRVTRKIIDEGADHIANVDRFLQEGEEGYESQQAELSRTLAAMREALTNKPSGCGLADPNGFDHFECQTCGFDVWVDS